MSKQSREALISLGSTPSTGFTITAIALSPVEPLVAESGGGVLRITNYQTAEVLGQVSIPFEIKTLSFSPDGKFLLAMPVDQTTLNEIAELTLNFTKEIENKIKEILELRRKIKELSPENRYFSSYHLSYEIYWKLEGILWKIRIIKQFKQFNKLKLTKPLLEQQILKELTEAKELKGIYDSYKFPYVLKEIKNELNLEAESNIRLEIFNSIMIFTEPWYSPKIIHNFQPLVLTLNAVWLNQKAVIIVGAVENNLPCISLFDLERGSQKILYQEEAQLQSIDTNIIYSVHCSSSGLIAFEISEKRRFYLYQYNQETNAVTRLPFNPSKIQNIAITENGQILLGQDLYNIVNVNPQGKELNKFKLNYSYKSIKTLQYTSGITCLFANSYKSQIYYIRNDQVRQWYSLDKKLKQFDFRVKDEKIVLAVSKEKTYSSDHTEIFELVDIDILQLTSENPEERGQAVRNLADRRFRLAVPDLIRHIWDDDLSVQKAAIKALSDIGDPTALPHLIRALGHKTSDRLQRDLVSALKKFPVTELSPVIFNCLNRPGVTYRRGAVRALQYMPSIEALEELCAVINDADGDIRLAASIALGKRKDLRACVALLRHLNDEDEDVRSTVQWAIIFILKINKLLAKNFRWHNYFYYYPDYYLDELAREIFIYGQSLRHLIKFLRYEMLPMDITAYAKEVISRGRMEQFESFGTSSVGEFLTGIASACIGKEKPVPQILNAIDALTIRHPGDIIGLTMAVICADTMRKQNRWGEAAHIYKNAVTIARRVEAPQIEWRSWYAFGKCLEQLRNDPKAMIAFRNAMDVIDRLWFALLEEDKLRDFFQDKAQLYDRAELCYLRLGHKALALECREKSKTRYLGDLIARRQMNPQVALAQELQEFWKSIGDARPVRASVGSPSSIRNEKVEIVAVEWGTSEAEANTIQAEQLAALEDAYETNDNLQQWLDYVRDIWKLMSYISTAEDESFRELLEDIYQALLPIYQAAKAESLPISTVEQEEYLNQFKQAAYALAKAGRGIEGAKFWLFSEYSYLLSSCLEKICTATEPPEEILLLNAVMEAFNSVLHHEPVIGVPSESLEEDQEGLIFTTRTLSRDSQSLNQKTTIIESSLERYSLSKWRYITQIARGQIATFRDIADDLNNQPQTAQIEFSVTEEGIVVYVTHGVGTPTQQTGLFPTNLKGKDGLEIFTYSQVTLASLRGLLLENDDSWITQYLAKEEQAWKDSMEKNLKELYKQLIELIESIKAHLKELNIKHLRIIPNRILNLIPFGALCYENSHGKLHYLIDEYIISYAPSATLQQICRERATNRTQKQELTAISNPTLDLSFASLEVETIASLFSVSEILPGEKATLAAVQKLSPNSFLHFACHGNYEWSEPLESALSLANSEYLNLGNLFEESINLPETMIATLSACETGISSPTDLVDEYIGLAAGFLFTGVAWCISSLWRVDEISTAFLMLKFYENLHQNNNVPIALNQAQVWLRDITKKALNQWIKDNKIPLDATLRMNLKRKLHNLSDNDQPFKDPYYWAAFCAIGR